MTAELVWSLADTHCVWCGLPKVGDAEWERHDGSSGDDVCTPDEASCWCNDWCWGACDVLVDQVMAGLRATVEAQAAVIARVNDGWHYAIPEYADMKDEQGVYWRYQDGEGNWVARDDGIPEELMSEAEQFVVYGEVVRTEEAGDG